MNENLVLQNRRANEAASSKTTDAERIEHGGGMTTIWLSSLDAFSATIELVDDPCEH